MQDRLVVVKKNRKTYKNTMLQRNDKRQSVGGCPVLPKSEPKIGSSPQYEMEDSGNSVRGSQVLALVPLPHQRGRASAPSAHTPSAAHDRTDHVLDHRRRKHIGAVNGSEWVSLSIETSPLLPFLLKVTSKTTLISQSMSDQKLS